MTFHPCPSLLWGTEVETKIGPAKTPELRWGDEVEGSIYEVLERSNEGLEARSLTTEAGEWLLDFLETVGGKASSAQCKKAGRQVGHSVATLGRARKKFRVGVESVGKPRETYWMHPNTDTQSQDAAESPVGSTIPRVRELDPTEPTEPTGDIPLFTDTTADLLQSDQLDQSDQGLGDGGTLIQLESKRQRRGVLSEARKASAARKKNPGSNVNGRHQSPWGVV